MILDVEKTDIWKQSPIIFSFVDYHQKDVEEYFDFSRVAWFNIPISLSIDEEELKEMRNLYDEQVRLGFIEKSNTNQYSSQQFFSHFINSNEINKNTLQFQGLLQQLIIKKEYK